MQRNCTHLDSPDACNGQNCCEGSEGAKVCLDDEQTLRRINDLTSAGVKTLVVGLPGTENYRQYLNAFAAAGGMPREGGDTQYYAPTNKAEPMQTLQDLTGRLVTSCEMRLAAPLEEENYLNVDIDGMLIPQTGNWQYTSQPPKVTLLGQACEKVKKNPASHVHLAYGCPTIM